MMSFSDQSPVMSQTGVLYHFRLSHCTICVMQFINLQSHQLRHSVQLTIGLFSVNPYCLVELSIHGLVQFSS